MKFLSRENKYNLFIDPLCVHFTIKESVRSGTDKFAEKRKSLRAAAEGLSKGQRRKMGTRRRTGPKIRSVKKGRTVKLRG